MPSNPDVIVIGGGIVGMSTAYHLARAGAQTLVIDRHDTGRATDAGAGILAPEISREADAWFNFAVAAVDYYPHLITQLEQEDAGDTGYARCGLLLVAASPDEITPFAEAQRLILARQRQRGYPSVEELHPVGAAPARERFPALGTIHTALYDACAARVDGRLINAALNRAALGRGVATLSASVDRLIIEHGQVSGVLAGGEPIHARAVVIAGGAWSASFGEQLGLTIPIEPQRGQIIHLDLPGVATGDWPVVNAFHGHYIVSWPGSAGAGRVVVGATRETGAGFAPHTTVSGVIEVLSEALRVAPGLAGAAIAEIRVGLRPRTPDNLPVLCRAPTVAGVVIAAGHGATGLQLGPLSGKIAAELALGQSPSVDIGALDIARFQ
ncbi:MAG: FAD-dependent oxidoreductase [Chloroflexi bacterium]|nr:MAG: FAD-dependent oxidoreductase [Chloroflexota bacterium]